MIYIGKKNKLKAKTVTDAGMILVDDDRNEVLLPDKFVSPKLKVHERIDVLVYRDSDDLLVATTIDPLIELEGFGFLRAREVTGLGAFMDWGIEKDLLVPLKEQASKMISGQSYIVFMYLDEDTQRLAGSTKIQKYLDNTFLGIGVGDEVDLLVFENSYLGYFVVINDRYKGLIYKNEVFQNIYVGDRLKGYVKNIKEGNEIDISIQKLGFENVLSNTEFILDYLKKHKGFLGLTDNSTPEEIVKLLNMSKKTFKKSIGILYRERLVMIQPDGVYLISEE